MKKPMMLSLVFNCTIHIKSVLINEACVYFRVKFMLCIDQMMSMNFMSFLQGDSKNRPVVQCSTTQWLGTVGHRGGARQRSASEHRLCCLSEEVCCHCREVSLLQVHRLYTAEGVCVSPAPFKCLFLTHEKQSFSFITYYRLVWPLFSEISIIPAASIKKGNCYHEKIYLMLHLQHSAGTEDK